MKIRKGFVSNSSSASFVIIGFGIDNSDSKETAKNVFDLSDEDIMDKMKASSYYKKYPEKLEDPKAIKEFCNELLYDLEEAANFDVLMGEGDIPDGKIVVGKIISYVTTEDQQEAKQFDVDELVTKIKTLQEEMGNTDTLKIYTGTMCC